MNQPSEQLSPYQRYKLKMGDARPWHALNKENMVDTETSSERYSICQECPSLIKMTNQCKECGCFMKLKTKLKTASCPIGKW